MTNLVFSRSQKKKKTPEHAPGQGFGTEGDGGYSGQGAPKEACVPNARFLSIGPYRVTGYGSGQVCSGFKDFFGNRPIS